MSSLGIEIERVSEGSAVRERDEVAIEEPLEIQLCAASVDAAAARSLSITMRTPGDDVDLALGFLYGESIIGGAGDVRTAEFVGPVDEASGRQNTLRVELKPGVEVDLDRLTRHFYTTSSCGVCGKASLDALRIVAAPLGDSPLSVDHTTVVSLAGSLRDRQRVFESTGGLHGAAAFDADGNLVVVREDVGRHNAVDKVVGALLADDHLPAGDLGLVVSGRASFELMQKALVAGMPMLVAIGAPSSLAVRLAREYGITLVGFLRGGIYNVYSGAERLKR